MTSQTKAYRETGAESSPIGEILSIPLGTPIDVLRYCPGCERQERFLFTCQILNGVLGTCTHCGMPGFEPFTRTISEAA